MRNRNVSLLFVLLAPPAWGTIFMAMKTAGAANVFTSDTHCQAVWLLENGALTTDSRGNGNTLTNTGVVATATHKEGSYAGDWESSDSDFMEIADASLSADFPLKTGDTTGDISVTLWVQFESFPAASHLFGKYNSSGVNYRSFAIQARNTSTNLGFIIGYASGVSYEAVWTATVTTGVWYHVGITYSQSTKAYTFRVWDDGAGSVISNASGNTTNTMSITAASVLLGARSGGADAFLDGILDEVVVFDDLLSTAEIDEIRSGTYDEGVGGGGTRRRIIMATN